MGNARATVSAGNKAQADKDACDWFRLVDLHGGGELVDLMKACARSRPGGGGGDYGPVDEAIRRRVLPYLYDGGKSQLVSAAELRYVRACYKQGKEPRARDYAAAQSRRGSAAAAHRAAAAAELPRQRGVDVLRLEIGRGAGGGRKTAPVDAASGGGAGGGGEPDDAGGGGGANVPVCWDLYKRGPVGETILHQCLLQACAVHAELAKRLLRNFPDLLVDTYARDQYYGETALHMAIVNEDPAMVRVLLGHDRWRLHERRCCGEFFCAEDQKRARRDHPRDDSIVVPAETSYAGYVYWGEYPLSFAASLGQEECARLLVAHGARLDSQDLNGNTALHMAVVRGRKDMYELLRSLGADTGVKNRQGLTPLTLAAKLGRKGMCDYILEKERLVFWSYGDVMCAAYPHADVDSIDDGGRINTRSALDLIVHGGGDEHLDMVEGIVAHLLDEKWRTFVERRFYRRLLFFCIYFVAFAVAIGLREVTRGSYGESAGNGSAAAVVVDAECYASYALSYDDSAGPARAVLEAGVLLAAAVYLALALREIYHQGWRVFAATLKYAPAKTLFLYSCVAVVLIAPSRLACTCAYEDVCAIVAMLCAAPYFLFFCRGMRVVGPFVAMIYKMIVGDFVRFVSIYVIFVLGFSQSLYVVFLGYGKRSPNATSPFTDPFNALMGVLYMSVGKVNVIHESLAGTRHHGVGVVAFTVYMIVVTNVEIKMFIAMMGNTYKLVKKARKEWLRQWANIVLVLEQSVSPDERLRQRRSYSQPLGDERDGYRALVVRWRQTAQELADRKVERERLHAQRVNALLRQRKRLASAAAAAAAR